MFYVFNRKSIIMVLVLGIFFFASILIYRGYSEAVTANVSSNLIIIDPGHGGEDGGAVGKSGNKEKDINLTISSKLKDKLLNSGFNVVMTREKDILLNDNNAKNKKRSDLNNRIKIAEQYKNATFLSIHMNYFDDENQKGAQIFYSKNNEKSKILAETIEKEIKTSLDPDNKRVSKPAGKEIYLLNHLKLPACLIECGFISNRSEEQQLLSDEYQNKLVDSIVQGLIKYISFQ